MNAHRIEVLDRADDDRVVGKIAHHLELVLFPAEHAFFDQALVDRREIEPAIENLFEFFAVVGDAAAGAAQREAGPQNHGIAVLRGEREPRFDDVDQLRIAASPVRSSASHL